MVTGTFSLDLIKCHNMSSLLKKSQAGITRIVSIPCKEAIFQWMPDNKYLGVTLEHLYKSRGRSNLSDGYKILLVVVLFSFEVFAITKSTES